MLDRIMLKENENYHFLRIILISIIMTFILAYVNTYLGSNLLFLVALIALAFSYPVTSYIRVMDREILNKFEKIKFLIKRHEKELVLFWSIFIGVTIGFYIILYLGFISDFSFQEVFVKNIVGNVTEFEQTFSQILVNNLKVTFFTFIISFLMFSGLIFVLIWNASILSYYLYSLGSHKTALLTTILLLSHGLLEIGGYIFAGIAGAMLAYRIDLAYSSKYYKQYNVDEKVYVKKKDRRGTFNKLLNKRFFLDISYLMLTSIIFIIVAAFIESI